MRAGAAGVVVLLAGLVVAPLAGPATAQVTMNPGALDLLPAPHQAPARQPPASQPKPASRPSSSQKPATPSVPADAAPAPARPPSTAPVPATTAKPVVPVVPPAIAALPPPAPVPPPRPQPAPVVPMAADAPGAASMLPGGVRVTFGADRQDLNPVTEAALREIARTLKANDQATVNVYAYAAGTPDDLSTARRLSLARALAARAVLVNEGIASTRIYPRALGSTGGDAGPDRVDVVIGTPGPPAPATAAQSGQAVQPAQAGQPAQPAQTSLPVRPAPSPSPPPPPGIPPPINYQSNIQLAPKAPSQ